MLQADALAALDRIPSKEALRRPLTPDDTAGRRTARLLAGDDGGAEAMTVGDALFRWARVEPEALVDADISALHDTSELLAAAGRLPRRFSLAAEVGRSAANVAAMSLGDMNPVDGSPILGTARAYLIQRLFVHLFDAQGCEAVICGAEADPTAILLNGLQAVVHDPLQGPPARIDRLTFVTQDLLEKMGTLASSPLVLALTGMDAGTLNGLVPGAGTLAAAVNEGLEICMYANAAAQAGRMLLRRDGSAMVNLSSLAASSVAGHVGHAAGQAAAIAVLGLSGSWMVVLAPIATGFTGRVVAKNLSRRARYHLFCRSQVADLKDAVRTHCIASRDALEANMSAADASAERFRDLHAAASGSVKDCIADWLDRIRQLQAFRRLNTDRFHRASIDPGILDTHGGDPVVAARESLLSAGRVGLHPANVASTAERVVASSAALHRRLGLAVV